LQCFADRGCFVRVFPAHTTYSELAAWNPHGYFLSNGPGDPAAMDYAVRTTKEILQADEPLFGICLGHQLLALAVDIPTYKMHHGHRGINHPVKNLISGNCEITSQNHGFGVNPQAIQDISIRWKSLTSISMTNQSKGYASKARGLFRFNTTRKLRPGRTTPATSSTILLKLYQN
jgi:carbamoyl-phosphate synthase small subunit